MEKKNSKYGKYIIEDLVMPQQFSEEFNARYSTYAQRVLWLDENLLPGTFPFNFSWYLKPKDAVTESHVHDADEILGFVGSDPQDPYNLNGEIEFWIEDEKFTLTRTCMIFIPKNVRHSPLLIKRVDKPIFHVMCVIGGQYEKLNPSKSK